MAMGNFSGHFQVKMEVSERYFPGDRGRVLYEGTNYNGGIVRGRRNFSLMGVGPPDSI